MKGVRLFTRTAAAAILTAALGTVCAWGVPTGEFQLAYRFRPGQEFLYRANVEVLPQDDDDTGQRMEAAFSLSVTDGPDDPVALRLALKRVTMLYPSEKLKVRLVYDVPGDTWYLNGLPLEKAPFRKLSEQELFHEIGQVFRKPVEVVITPNGSIERLSSSGSFGDVVSRSNVRDVLELLFIPGLPEGPASQGTTWTRLRQMKGSGGRELSVRADYELASFSENGSGHDARIEFVASATSRIDELSPGNSGKELALFFVLDGHGTVTVDAERGVLVSNVMEVESSFEVQSTEAGSPMGVRRLHSVWKFSVALDSEADPEAAYK